MERRSEWKDLRFSRPLSAASVRALDMKDTSGYERLSSVKIRSKSRPEAEVCLTGKTSGRGWLALFRLGQRLRSCGAGVTILHSAPLDGMRLPATARTEQVI